MIKYDSQNPLCPHLLLMSLHRLSPLYLISLTYLTTLALLTTLVQTVSVLLRGFIPLLNFLSLKQVFIDHLFFPILITCLQPKHDIYIPKALLYHILPKPTSVKIALQKLEWKEENQSEYNCLVKNGTSETLDYQSVEKKVSFPFPLI